MRLATAPLHGGGHGERRRIPCGAGNRQDLLARVGQHRSGSDRSPSVLEEIPGGRAPEGADAKPS